MLDGGLLYKWAHRTCRAHSFRPPEAAHVGRNGWPLRFGCEHPYSHRRTWAGPERIEFNSKPITEVLAGCYFGRSSEIGLFKDLFVCALEDSILAFT